MWSTAAARLIRLVQDERAQRGRESGRRADIVMIVGQGSGFTTSNVKRRSGRCLCFRGSTRPRLHITALKKKGSVTTDYHSHPG